ncbi:MAG: MFS transporter, partial [Bdellovibrionales bacterium]
MFLNTIFKDRQFTSLFWTQFLGALNDNFFKNALVVMITFRGVQIGGIGTSSLVALAGAIFIFPFFLFSPLAGQLSDKFEKSKIVRYTKIWEVLIMLLGVAGFLWESFPLLLAVLFLMGVHSTFFGPVKYSILPQIVPAGKLMLANAYVELGTFLAILIGTIAGGLAASSVHATTINSVGIILFALLGLIAAWRLGPVTRGNPDLYVRYNPIPTFREMWSLLREKTAIFNSVLGISWFWFFGAGILSVLPIYCKDYLGADESVVTAFLTMFTLGIGAGSILCERLSHGRVEIGLVPFGSLGMTVFMVDLFFVIPSWLGTLEAPMTFSQFVQTPEGLRLLGDFLLTSLFGGFFIVPLYALIQERSHSASRSRVIAANNVMNAFFMVISSALVMTFYQARLTLPQMFLVFAALNAIVAVYIYTVVPEFTLRF